MSFAVYLSGEVHTNWRDEVMQGAIDKGLEIEFLSAVDEAVSVRPLLVCASSGFLCLFGMTC